ncbi:MAG: hypothetical protein Q4B03_08405 [Lachnospiraceae bacterium]|nr:hypothetical protein [Lachnospiraceae bacterium]
MKFRKTAPFFIVLLLLLSACGSSKPELSDEMVEQIVHDLIERASASASSVSEADNENVSVTDNDVDNNDRKKSESSETEDEDIEKGDPEDSSESTEQSVKKDTNYDESPVSDADPQESEAVISDEEIALRTEQAIQSGLNVLSGSLIICDWDSLLTLQGHPPGDALRQNLVPEPDTYYILQLKEPQAIDLMSSDGTMRYGRECTMIDLGSINGTDLQNGDYAVVAFDPNDGCFPSDVSLPLGEPSLFDYELLAVRH